MESGIVTLYDGSVVLSSSSTAEEIKAVVQGIVEKLCEVSGMSIVNTIDTDYGARFYAGKNGKAIFVISPIESNNKYSQLLFSKVGINNTLIVNTSSSGSNIMLFYGTKTNKLFMQYVKAGDCFACKIVNSQSNNAGGVDFSKSSVSFATSVITNENEENEPVFLLEYTGVIYPSYSEILGNNLFSKTLFNVTGTIYPLIPTGKDAFFDIYLDNGAKLEGMKLYSNKNSHAQFSIVEANGRKYIPVFSKSTWQIVIEVQEEDEVQGSPSMAVGGGITNSEYVDSSSFEVLGGAS